MTYFHEQILVVRELLTKVTMQHDLLQKTTMNQLLQFLAGERFAEEIYSKAFLDLDGPETLDNIAMARLCHLRNIALLESLTQASTEHSSEGFRQTGPFSGDPRAAIYGIDPKFVCDYLRESEARSIALYQDAANDEGLTAELPDGTLESLLETANAAQSAFLGYAASKRRTAKPGLDSRSRVG